MHSKWTRLLSMVLCLAMVLSYMPAAVFATDEGLEESCAHEYIPDHISSTCTEDGYTVYSCSLCGDSFTDYDEPSTGHTYHYFPEWSEDYSTCSVTRRCTRDESHTDTVTAESTSERIEPTCEDEGYIDYFAEIIFYDDDICLEDTTVTIPALGHDYSISTKIEATCEDYGRTEYICSICEDIYEGDIVPALEHSYVVEVFAPTCDNEGYTSYTCSACGDYYEDDFIDALEHSYTAEVTPPTCYEEGCTTYTCSECGDWYDDDFVDRLEHSYDAEVTAPTCTYGGYTTYTCSECGDFYTGDETEAAGHDTYETITPASCTEGGFSIFYCNNCADINYGNKTEPLGHDYINGACSVCGEADPNSNIKESGTFGTLTYTVYDDGSLLISGTGDMTSYTSATSYNFPWYGWRNIITKVVIADGVTGIGDYAFNGMTGIEEIQIADSVTSIGEGAFYGCTGLTNVTMPEALAKIGFAAFYGCSGLTEITIPGTVTLIPDNAFTNCSKLEKITLPGSITEVGYASFYNCSKLTSVHFGGSCTAWKKVTVDENNTYLTGATVTCDSHEYAGVVTAPTFTEQGYTTYTCSVCGASYVDDYTDPVEYMSCGENAKWKIVNGTLYIEGTGAIENYSGNGTYAGWYAYKDDIIAVDVGEWITSIGNWAFYGLTSAGAVSLPSTLTTIGSSSFRGMTSLESITIPDSVTDIDDYAFLGCTALGSVSVPDSVTSLGISAFKECTALNYVYLGEGITTIRPLLFNRCTALETVFINGDVTIISYSAFTECTALSGVFLPLSLTTVKQGAFDDCGNFAVRYQGSYFDWKNITIESDNDALMNATVTYVIPSGELNDGITWIIEEDVLTISGTGAPVVEWENAPWAPYCETVTSVIMSDGITTVPSTAFTGFTKLTSVSIPDSVEIISQLAFKGCSALTDIELPDSLFLIGDEAFYGCSSITSLHYPAGLVTIGSEAFVGCTGLQNITVSGDNQFFSDTNGVLMSKDKTGLISYPAGRTDDSYVVPSGVTKICHGAFTDSVISAISIPASIETIDFAFDGCLNLKNVNYDGLRSEWNNLTINWNNSALFHATFTFGSKSGTCGNNMTWVLKDCVLTISGTGVMLVAPWSDYANDIDEIVIENGVTTICDNAFAYCDNVTSVTIPEGVIRIGTGAFSNCDNLAAVSIPSSMTLIMDRAFSGCYNLSSIDLPDNTRQIGTSAFAGCTALTSVTMPGVRIIGENAFAYTGLTFVVLPDTLTTMGIGLFEGCESLVFATLPAAMTALPGDTFKYCSSLTKLALPETITEIGAYAFYDCGGLKTLTLPASLTTIGTGAFAECINLTEIAIPEGVAVLPNSLFHGCISLKTVTIPDSVTEICNSTFNGCMTLESVTIPCNVAKIGDYAFGDCSSLLTITFNGDSPVIGNNAFYYVVGADVLYPDNGFGWEDIANDTENNGFGGVLYWKPYTGKDFVRTGTWYHVKWTFDGETLTVDSQGWLQNVDSGWYPWNKYASAVKKLVLLDGITVVDQDAFKSFTALTELTLPEGIRMINDGAFEGCTALATISFPSTLESIGLSFTGCTGLKSFTYNGTNTTWNQLSITDTVINTIPGKFSDPTGTCGDNLTWKLDGSELTISGTGAMYDYTSTTMPWYEYQDQIRTVSIESGVTSIGAHAFGDHNALQTVKIPVTVKTIGDYAFMDCAVIDTVSYTGTRYQFDQISVGFSNVCLTNVEPSCTGRLATPTSLSSSNIASTGNIKLSWSSVNGASKYYVYRATSSGGTYSYIGSATGTTYTDSKATPGVCYYYKVKAACADGNGVTSYYSSYTYRTADCASPVVKSSVVASSGNIQLTWKAITDATKYEIYRATSYNGTYSYWSSTSDTSYITGSGTAGTTYYFKVKAICGKSSYGDSALSSYVFATKDCAQPVVSASVVASSGNIQLTWKAITGATKYEIYRATSYNGAYSYWSSTTDTSYITGSGTPGTTYYFKVKAICGKSSYGNSALSSYVFATKDCAQPVVSATVVTSSGNIKLSWSAVTGATKYEVYRATSATGTYTKLYTTTSTSYTNTTGIPGTTYYYKVKAICGKSSYGNSALSTYAYATKDCARPVVSITRTSAGKPKLSWTKVTGATRYYVYRSTSVNGTYSYIGSTTGAAYTDSSAVKGKTYYYKVKAICGKSSYGNSALSTAKSITAK